MNYWHIQLHPDNRKDFSNKVIREILSEKKIIGLGEWEQGEKQREQFQNNMKIGDVVELFGDNITIDEVADQLGTINYEIVCMMSKRIPRLYLLNGEEVEYNDYIVNDL